MKEFVILISLSLYSGDIETLGSKKYMSRERARARLISAGYFSIPAVHDASKNHRDIEVRKRCEEITRKYFLSIFSNEDPPRICMLSLSKGRNTITNGEYTDFKENDWGFNSVYYPKRNLLGVISEKIMRSYHSNDDDFKDEVRQREVTEKVVYKLCVDNPFPADIMKKLISRMQHLDKNWEFGD